MKFLHVDMTHQQIKVEDVPPEYVGLGGRGLTSILINAQGNTMLYSAAEDKDARTYALV